MEINITQETHQPDTFRKIYQGSVSYAGSQTPSRKEVIEAFAQEKKAAKDCIIVRKITPSFGNNVSDVTIFVYDSAEAKEKLEAKYMVARNTKTEETPEEAPEKKAEETAPESPEDEKDDAEQASQSVAEEGAEPSQSEKPAPEKEAETSEEKKPSE